MIYKTNNTFKIDDYYEDDNSLNIISNIKPDLNVLRESKTLEILPKIKTAKIIKIAPKESDFLYVRNRAVSAGNVIENHDGSATSIPLNEFHKHFNKYAKICRLANKNGDFFSEEELKSKYKTFIGKSVFVDHNNENVENARGIIVDSVWNDRGKYVELLKAVDRKAYPELARAIEKGYVDSTSMGCRCRYSICSICGNKSATEDDFCKHILYYKGGYFNGLPVFEENCDIEFFEDSFVTEGADPDAKVLEKVASMNYIHKHTSHNEYNHILNEKNQRCEENQLINFKDKLKDLPWS